ncbi:MAG: transglutaminase-like domain-containing protein [Patescibacteria group bacterium]
MPGEKHQQINPKNERIEKYLKRSVDRGAYLDKKQVVEAATDVFQREKKLQEDILKSYEAKEISEFDYIVLAKRVFEECDSERGWELLKNLKIENIDPVSLFGHKGVEKHQLLFNEIERQIKGKISKLNSFSDKKAILLRIEYLKALDKIQNRCRENKKEEYQSLDQIPFSTKKAQELYIEINNHYSEYLRLKKLKALDFKDSRSAGVTLAESTLQEFFTPETEPQKVNHSVGVNINSGKKRAKQLRLLRRILDETLNDPEQNWREKQQEFAREVAIDGLQKEIKRSLEKTNPEARLEFDGEKGEFVVYSKKSTDGTDASIAGEKIELIPEKITGYIFYKRNSSKIISVGNSFVINEDGKQIYGFVDTKQHEERNNYYGFGFFHNDDLWIRTNSDPEIELDDNNIIYFDKNYARRDKILFGNNHPDGEKYIFLVQHNGELKKIFGIDVACCDEPSFFDNEFVFTAKTKDEKWHIVKEDGSKITIPNSLIPISKIYKPIDKMVFVAHELDENGQSTGSVIVDTDGNKISQKHDYIDFKGEYIFSEYIYIKKGDPQFNPDGPEEIWGTTSGRLAASGSSIKKIWGVQDRLYWVNGQNEFFTKYTDIKTHKDVVEKLGQYDSSKIEFITRMTKDGANDRIIYPDNIGSIKPGAVGLDFIDSEGKRHILGGDRHFWNVLKVESIQEKCLVVQEHKGKITVYVEGIGDVGGEWDKIYFLKEYENQLLICGRRGDEIVEVAVDLDKKAKLTPEEATKLKLLNLLKKYDWLAYEERSVRKNKSNTYSKSGKEKLAEKSDKLKNDREELKKKILDYFENDSVLREIWQKWDPEKDYRSHSKNFADKITKMVRTSPELFLDYFRAKKDRNVEKLAREMVDFVFKEYEEKIENEPAKKDHWVKGLAKNIISTLLGEKTREQIGSWWQKNSKKSLNKPNLADFFQDSDNIKILGGDPEEKGPGLEVMKFGREYKGFIYDQILGKCDNGKNWSKIDFPATFLLTEPTKETTVTINVDKKWDKIILPKPVQSAIISSRIKGITSKGKEISLEKSGTTNKFGQRTVIFNPKDNIAQLRYSWKENQFETKMLEIEEYDSFRNKFIWETKISDLTSDIAPKMDENFGEILEKIELLSPKGKVEAIEEFVKKIGYYDMKNAETLEDKNDITLDERLILMKSRMDSLKKNPKMAGKLEKKFVAGVCADYALLTVALLRKAGFMAGYASGFDVNGKVATSKEAHAKAFVLWPDKDGNATLQLVDGTPGGIDEKQQNEIDGFLNIETIEKKEKITEQKKERKIKTVKERVQELMSLRVEDIAKIDNGELEKILNDYLALVTKKSHFKIVERVLNTYWYTGSERKDMSNQDIKRKIQFLLLEEFGKEYNSILEKDKKVASGKEMFEMVETFIDKFKKQDKDLATSQALENIRIIIETVPKGLLSRPERVAMEIIVKYLEAKKMSSQLGQNK